MQLIFLYLSFVFIRSLSRIHVPVDDAAAFKVQRIQNVNRVVMRILLQ